MTGLRTILVITRTGKNVCAEYEEKRAGEHEKEWTERQQQRRMKILKESNAKLIENAAVCGFNNMDPLSTAVLCGTYAQTLN